MNNQSGPGRRGEDPQRHGRQDDERERRSAGGDQGGQSGKNAGPVLPEGEKIGEWSEKESDKESDEE
jgi:hypothetical protein